MTFCGECAGKLLQKETLHQGWFKLTQIINRMFQTSQNYWCVKIINNTMYCETVRRGCDLKNIASDFLFVEMSFWRLSGFQEIVSFYILSVILLSVSPWGLLKILQSKDAGRLLQSIYCIDTLPRHADRMSPLHGFKKTKKKRRLHKATSFETNQNL